ncbi:MAG: hypothetical protein GF330_13820 [Candidatus Eisenbacteria bacterium]|nr:hypothetical protein [Candidatus Eisenbacteria bacterium]
MRGWPHRPPAESRGARGRMAARMLVLLLGSLVLPSPCHPADSTMAGPKGSRERRGLRSDLLDLALLAAHSAHAAGYGRKPLLTIIDYSLPSSERRLWVLDLDTREVLFREYVAHGRGSGRRRATRFSNEPESRASSLGLFETGEIYRGKHGLSLRLEGLEPGFNDHARERAIVMHGAWYVSEEHVEEYGRLGRSWGCPALDRAITRSLIETIAGGSLLFVYYPDSDWLSSSRFLAGATGASDTTVTGEGR